MSALLVSLDPLLLGAELAILATLVAATSRFLGQLSISQPFYDDLISLCKTRNISITEVLGLLTLTLGFIVFDAVLALSEDDLFDNVGYLLLACAGITACLTLVGIDIQYFLMTSGASSGEPRVRVLYVDLLNNVLSMTRILFCWLRYLFYDLQAELVDMVFHYAETGDVTASASFALGAAGGPGDAQGLLWGTLTTLVLQGLVVVLDLGCWAFQTLLGGLKLMLALYLF